MKYRILTIFCLCFSIVTGCYYSAGEKEVSEIESRQESEGESGREETVKPENSNTESTKGAEEQTEVTDPADEYLLQYVPKVYSINEPYEYFFDGEGAFEEKDDYIIAVTGFEIGTQELAEEFDYCLTGENSESFRCSEDECFVYYRLEITGGERLTTNCFTFGNHKIISVMTDPSGNAVLNGEGISDEMSHEFYPRETIGSEHDDNVVELKPGETKQFLCVEKANKALLKDPLYLCINPGGTGLMELPLADVSYVSDLEKAAVGIVRLSGEE